MLFKDDLNNMYLARVMGECGKRASSNEQVRIKGTRVLRQDY